MNIESRLENLVEIATRIAEATEKNSEDISSLIAIVRKHDSEILALRRDFVKTIDTLKDR